jgi:hypothetical protein
MRTQKRSSERWLSSVFEITAWIVYDLGSGCCGVFFPTCLPASKNAKTTTTCTYAPNAWLMCCLSVKNRSQSVHVPNVGGNVIMRLALLFPEFDPNRHYAAALPSAFLICSGSKLSRLGWMFFGLFSASIGYHTKAGFALTQSLFLYNPAQDDYQDPLSTMLWAPKRLIGPNDVSSELIP